METKVEVKINRGLFTRRTGSTANKRRNRVEEMLENREVHENHLAPFKTTPEFFDNHEMSRPIPAACKICIPSCGTSFSGRKTMLGIRDCFTVTNMDKDQSWYLRLMPHFLHYWRVQNINWKLKYPDTKDIMRDPNLTKLMFKIYGRGCNWDKRIEKNKGAMQAIQNEQFRGEAFLKTFASPLFPVWLQRMFDRFKWWLLGKLFSFMFVSIGIHKAHVNILQEIQEKGLPVVYLPLSRSHFDSFILSWTLVTCGVNPPVFVGSHSFMQNYHNRYLVKMFGGLGCMGKRRGTDISYGKPILSATIHTYFSTLLRNNVPLQFVLETNRSRNGLPRTKLAGGEFLNIFVDHYLKNELEDVFIVPVSVNYEVLPDEDIVSNYSVCNNTYFKKLWNFLTRKLGRVRLSISQPFRLLEFERIKSKSRVSSRIWSNGDEWENEDIGLELPVSNCSGALLTGGDMHWDDDKESVSSLSSIYGENLLLLPPQHGAQERLIDSLTRHIVYDAMKSTVFMSTQMVSFLLLNRFPQGTTIKKFIYEMDLLKICLNDRKRDVGFCGEMENVVMWAIDLLGPELVSVDNQGDNKTIKPILTENSMKTLRYYSNHLTQLYVLEAAVATAILCAFDEPYQVFVGTEITTGIDEEEIINNALQICQVLKGEFILYPRCKEDKEVVRETLDYMADQGMILFEMKKVYMDDDEIFENTSGKDFITERRVEINLSYDIVGKLEFLRNLIRPLLEVHAVFFQSLKCLVKTPEFSGEMREVDLRNKILTDIQEHYERGVITKCGLKEVEVVRNTIINLININVIKCFCMDQDLQDYGFFLSQRYNSNKFLDELTYCLLNYCTY